MHYHDLLFVRFYLGSRFQVHNETSNVKELHCLCMFTIIDFRFYIGSRVQAHNDAFNCKEMHCPCISAIVYWFVSTSEADARYRTMPRILRGCADYARSRFCFQSCLPTRSRHQVHNDTSSIVDIHCLCIISIVFWFGSLLPRKPNLGTLRYSNIMELHCLRK